MCRALTGAVQGDGLPLKFVREANTQILVWVHLISIWLLPQKDLQIFWVTASPSPTKREDESLGIAPAHILSHGQLCITTIAESQHFPEMTHKPPVFSSHSHKRSGCWRSFVCFARVSFEFWFTVAIRVLQVRSSKVQKSYLAFCPRQKVEKSVMSWRPLSWQDHMDSWAVDLLQALKWKLEITP